MFKIVPDDENEKFTESDCNCAFCWEMKRMNSDWRCFEPKTQLQKRMKEVARELESKYGGEFMLDTR